MDTHSNRWISTSTASGSTTYGYDAEGNTLNVLPLATTTQATVDLNDRLTSWNGQTYTYDADGNLTGNGTDTYVWNARNQLTAIKQGSTTIASFSYDPLGRRVGTDFNGNATSYLYDGLNAVQETHGSTATSILTGLAVDERFARTDLSGRTDFLSDALNSTIALTNSAGAIVEQYSYDPYGTTTASVSGFDNPYQYTGRENDGDGLYYYRARYYAPAMGRFISEDPLNFASGSSNFYAYVGGNPISYLDPLGLQCTTAQRILQVVQKFVEAHVDDTITFDAGDGFGVEGSLTLTKVGSNVLISGRVGIGIGIGVGSAVTANAHIGNPTGFGVQGSVAGGDAFSGVAASASAADGGPGASAGLGLGLGAGATATVGYSGDIGSFHSANTTSGGSGCGCNH
jgi:RHS repeat-associated protein